MWWMWIVGPGLLLVIYVLTGARDKRAEAEIERWRRDFWPRVKTDEVEGSDDRAAPANKGAKSEKKAAAAPGGGAKQVSSLPGPLHRMILASGGGEPVMRIELAPKLAYLAAFAASPATLSDQKTVVARLEEPVPAFSARPLPILEGARIANTGVEFKKDPDFMSLFLVEAGTDPGANAPDPASPEVAKKIRAFLSRPIRDALRDLPDAWLRVEDKAMALTLYGPADAEKIDQLVTTADVIFAEYGADGGPSLFGEDDDEDEAAEALKSPEAPKAPAAAKAKPKKKPAAAS